MADTLQLSVLMKTTPFKAELGQVFMHVLWFESIKGCCPNEMNFIIVGVSSLELEFVQDYLESALPDASPFCYLCIGLEQADLFNFVPSSVLA